MSLATRTIVIGTAGPTKVREANNKTTGDLMVFTNVIVFGEYCIADVRIPKGMTAPQRGDSVAMLVETGVWRDDDQTELVEYLDPAMIASELGYRPENAK